MIFITDRLSGSKYNYTDLNRVEGNVFLISQMLNEYGYTDVINTKTDWTSLDFPKATSMQTYIDNVNTIKNSFYSLAPNPPTVMDNLTYISANNIEKTLNSVYDLIINMEETFKYSGEFYSGNDILI